MSFSMNLEGIGAYLYRTIGSREIIYHSLPSDFHIWFVEIYSPICLEYIYIYIYNTYIWSLRLSSCDCLQPVSLNKPYACCKVMVRFVDERLQRWKNGWCDHDISTRRSQSFEAYSRCHWKTPWLVLKRWFVTYDAKKRGNNKSKRTCKWLLSIVCCIIWRETISVPFWGCLEDQTCFEMFSWSSHHPRWWIESPIHRLPHDAWSRN